MALEKTVEAKFTFTREKITDTECDVVVVRDENNKNRRVCMIHPESGTFCFTFRGTLTDFKCDLNFYTIAEIQILIDAAKKLNKAHQEFEKTIDKTIKGLK